LRQCRQDCQLRKFRVVDVSAEEPPPDADGVLTVEAVES
jgi:hypothetical protein